MLPKQFSIWTVQYWVSWQNDTFVSSELVVCGEALKGKNKNCYKYFAFTEQYMICLWYFVLFIVPFKELSLLIHYIKKHVKLRPCERLYSCKKCTLSVQKHEAHKDDNQQFKVQNINSILTQIQV